MKCWLGYFLNLLVCPHCQGSLIKEKEWLICRYHKLGYPIDGLKVDFRIERACQFRLEDIKSMRKHT